jgi:hypothetical protein
MIVITEDFAFLKKVQLKVVAQFEDPLCFLLMIVITEDFAFLKKVQLKTVSAFSNPNPNLEITRICS